MQGKCRPQLAQDLCLLVCTYVLGDSGGASSKLNASVVSVYVPALLMVLQLK